MIPKDEDYARKLVLDSQTRNRFRDDLKGLARNNERVQSRNPIRISVVLPTYRGIATIGRALDSINSQTLHKGCFEVLVIVNGPDDGTWDWLEQYQLEHPALQLRTTRLQRPSAGAARNLGLVLARGDFVTFLDDDDEFQPEFLDAGLRIAGQDHISVLPLENSHDQQPPKPDSVLSQRILANLGSKKTISDVSWVLGFNACKIVPRSLLTELRYSEDLTSGEDLVFFAGLATQGNLAVHFSDQQIGASYIRHIRDGSVSRQQNNFKFLVQDRLACIAGLEEHGVSPSAPEYRLIDDLIRSQANFIRNYLIDHPEDTTAVFEAVDSLALATFPWDMFHSEDAQTLAFLYCFAPYSDTSAIVAAKLIAQNEELVDVVSNNMDKIRHKDRAVELISRRYVRKQEIVDAPASFSGWHAISTYATRALSAAEKIRGSAGPYPKMYSRAVWIGSHVAGALYKLRYPETYWRAEFSDPLRRDSLGNPRAGNLTDGYVTERLLKALRAHGFGDLAIETVFDLTEIVSFVLADELVFTNRNQMDYMLSIYDSHEIQELVRKKALIREPPVPKRHVYSLANSGVTLPEDTVNIGYFGAFYPNRGIDAVLVAIANLPAEARSSIRLHVYSNAQSNVTNRASELGVTANVYSNPNKSYLQFLNLTTQFDVLMVSDAETSNFTNKNPFLPSKYADYVGSGAHIWAIVEEGSPLAQKETIRFKSQVGNSSSIRNTLIEISELGAGSREQADV